MGQGEDTEGTGEGQEGELRLRHVDRHLIEEIDALAELLSRKHRTTFTRQDTAIRLLYAGLREQARKR